MDFALLEKALNSKLSRLNKERLDDAAVVSPKILKVRDRNLSYAARHRGSWHVPEYNFTDIQVAQHTDSFVLRALKKKTDRLALSGFDFISKSEDALAYIKRRISEMEIATSKPWDILIRETAHDLFRFNNCMWAKTRDRERSSGQVRTDIRGVELDPVAGYHIIQFETLSFKRAKNGELKKIKQTLPSGDEQEFFPADVIHFYIDKSPGFTVGTPALIPALDDIALLRRIEENVEELIETNLFPVFHYSIGSDNFPARYAPDGTPETVLAKKEIEYMPSGGFIVTDHRHKFEILGSESKALRIDMYLDYFKKRVFAALDVSSVDFGEGDTSNRSTASTLSKGMMMDIEAMQWTLSIFIEFYVINELLLEGGFNPMDSEQQVHLKFGTIDKQERLAIENNIIQKFTNNTITQTEARAELGLEPIKEEDHDDTYFKRYTEPLELLKQVTASTLPGQVLGDLPTSNIQPGMAKSQKLITPPIQGGSKTASKSGSGGSSASKARPSNQHGSRSGPKTNRDFENTNLILYYKDQEFNVSLDFIPNPEVLDSWYSNLKDSYSLVEDFGIKFETYLENQLYKLIQLNKDNHNG